MQSVTVAAGDSRCQQLCLWSDQCFLAEDSRVPDSTAVSAWQVRAAVQNENAEEEHDTLVAAAAAAAIPPGHLREEKPHAHQTHQFPPVNCPHFEPGAGNDVMKGVWTKPLPRNVGLDGNENGGC